MNHYYNEFNPEAAAMLRQFMKDGLIPHGDVDERSITEVTPDDVKGYRQCHFFAGIAGWQFALQQAGWPADRPVWTGSCPCQPFSSAGRHKGKEDDRHMWPAWERLISECQPPVIFGEQVASAITQGWLDDVYEMLEAKGYAIGSAVLPASAVGAPHKRERLWFVADSNGERLEAQGAEQQAARTWGSGESSRTMGDTKHNGQPTTTQQGSNGASVQHDTQGQDGTSELEGAGCTHNVADTQVRRCKQQQQQSGSVPKAVGSGQGNLRGNGESVVPNAQQQGLEGYNRHDGTTQRRQEQGRPVTKGHWDDAEWLLCPDGKARPVGRGVPMLAHGVQHRKPILHALGNAIVPPLAAEFIGAFMDTIKERE